MLQNNFFPIEGNFHERIALTQTKSIYILLIQFYGSMSVLIREKKYWQQYIAAQWWLCFGMLIVVAGGKFSGAMLHCCWRNEGRHQFSCSCVRDIINDFNSPTFECFSSLSHSSLDSSTSVQMTTKIFHRNNIKYTQFYRCCINFYPFSSYMVATQKNPHNYIGKFTQKKVKHTGNSSSSVFRQSNNAKI